MTARIRKHGAPRTRHGDPDLAIERYLAQIRSAESAGLDPPATALNGLGDAYLDKGDRSAALSHYRRSSEAYAAEGLLGNAIACLKKVRRLMPDEDGIAPLLGRFYAEKGLVVEALREFERHADRQERLGQRREAIAALREIVRLAPDGGAWHERLAVLYAEEGEPEKAEAARLAGGGESRDGGDPEATQRDAGADAPPHGASQVTETDPPDRVAESPPSGVRGLEPTTIDGAQDTPHEAPPAHERAVERAEYGVPAAPPAATRPIDGVRAVDHEAAIEPETPIAPEPAPAPESRHTGESAPPPAPEPAPAPEAGSTPDMESFPGVAAPDTPPVVQTPEALQEQGLWSLAVDAYRRRYEVDGPDAASFDGWAECARQAGDARALLEALETAAHEWIKQGDRDRARRTAEEMLLVDPSSLRAAEILARVGAHLPPT